MRVTSAVTSVEATCVNLALLVRMIRAFRPLSFSSPSSVIQGPGLFEQPLAVAFSFTDAFWERDELIEADHAVLAIARSMRVAGTMSLLRDIGTSP